MGARGATGGSLLKDLRRQVAELEDDLRARSDSIPEYQLRLLGEYGEAKQAERTAATYETWRDERITQIAAAWVLACVFVRFCEDNGLIEHNWIAGVGDRLRDAEEHHDAYIRANPEKNDRDWLLASFEHLAGTHPAVTGLFDTGHNPLWEMEPSYEAVSRLLRFWRRVGPDGEIVHSFCDPDLNTRFLGDLYQDLSEHARKTYALLQTPVFVEEFILDLTLEPAVKEFGLEPVATIRQADDTVRELPQGLRTIDPACGSGHFLLGLFERLLKKWRDSAKAEDDWTLIRRALESVHGCDKNPFAVAIARFRLLVAVLKAAGAERLDSAPDFPINVAVGDSLLHGRGAPRRDDEDLFSWRDVFYYRSEDIAEYADRCDLLTRDSYHVVVGNPPYITVKDKQEKNNYRVYETCSGQYALSVPFAERFFHLSIRTAGSQRDAGYVGQITANSFMKREFGKSLIEDFFTSKVHLTHVIDTSGAYIPGHGTPTVILIGRNYFPRWEEPIRAVLGIRGEPIQPASAKEGLVWTAIRSQVEAVGSESEWVSVIDARREQMAKHPWSLGGGGASQLLAQLNKASQEKLSSQVTSVGFFAVTREDDAYMIGSSAARRWSLPDSDLLALLGGNSIRDWSFDSGTYSIFPYSADGLLASIDDRTERVLWPYRLLLKIRRALSGAQEEQGLAWFEYSSFTRSRFVARRLIAFPFVATHAHFSLNRGRRGFIRTAPVVKLRESASEEECLELLGVLNSSVTCFWLKQVSQGKGGSGLGRGLQDEEWEERFEFTGTKLQNFPLPVRRPLSIGRTLDALAQKLPTYADAIRSTGSPSRARLDSARDAWNMGWQQMIALQEELDWEVYHSYGLLNGSEKGKLNAPDPTPDTVPLVQLGERAFEIVLARKMAAGEIETAWFERHGSTPITEIPTHWPQWYRDIVQARIDTIESRRDIGLIERPEYKRRWSVDPWEKREKAALRTWLLDRCEDRSLWFHIRDQVEQPRTLTVGQLADELSNQPDAADIASVAGLYAAHLSKPNYTLEQVLTDVIDAEHVPYLAAYRYKDTGLSKRAQWEFVWEQQREEDRTDKRLEIPVPPKYASADFARTSYWSNRGKLDVPKERFVSYPDANPDSDPTLLLGWAGWDQRDQALALLNIVQDRQRAADWPTERIVPLLAGIAELMPWLWQWFGEVDEEWGEESAAEEIQSFLDGQLADRQLTHEALAEWRPAKRGRGGRKASERSRKATVSQQLLRVDGDGDE